MKLRCMCAPATVRIEVRDALGQPAVRHGEGVDVEHREALLVWTSAAPMSSATPWPKLTGSGSTRTSPRRRRYSTEPSEDPLSTTMISVSPGDIARVASSIGWRKGREFQLTVTTVVPGRNDPRGSVAKAPGSTSAEQAERPTLQRRVGLAWASSVPRRSRVAQCTAGETPPRDRVRCQARSSVASDIPPWWYTTPPTVMPGRPELGCRSARRTRRRPGRSAASAARPCPRRSPPSSTGGDRHPGAGVHLEGQPADEELVDVHGQVDGMDEPSPVPQPREHAPS